ncbi:MAG TPA: capsule assembly Wzi family protein [Gammaproteobacteria bacterium]
MRFSAIGLALLLAAVAAHARGVTPYLVLAQSPEVERAAERVLILADEPVLSRPIPAARVLDALPEACEVDSALCEQVRHYLAGLMKTAGIAHLSASGAADSGDSGRPHPEGAGGEIAPTTLPNRHGMPYDSAYEVSARAYWQGGDHVLLNGGFVAYEDEVVPTGTVLSIGYEYAQLDVGWRDHWLSPMTGSAMLLSAQAQTLPSVTLSNYTPITRLGIRYEIFVAELSESDQIRFEDGFTTGKPRLAGVHLSIEPVPGWSIGVNRLMQYGGGERGQDSFSDLVDALFRPSEFDNTGTVSDFGNQVASITSSFVMPTDVPFSVYFEYAGEDTSTNSNARLGNVGLSAGIRFPSLGRRGHLDLTLEASEWQNGWYVHHIYRDGLTNEGNVIGHWGADWRVAGDGVGGRALMTRIGWQLAGGGLMEATYRTLANEEYTAPEYDRAHLLDLRYSRRWRDEFHVGGEVIAGRDVFGESFSRVGAFIRF